MPAIVLPANQPPARFYRGGELISRFRRQPPDGEFVPEDWIASTTTLFGHESLGLTTLPSGVVLREAIGADPVAWLGPEHVGAFGADSRLLVKLLHAGQRLPVHAHPDGEFARAHLGAAHGKVEAWHVLNGGDVHVGLRRDTSAARLAELVEHQDVETILGLLHRREVGPGDTVHIPAGMLHAIGEGVLVTELQEPEDLSILLEWRDFAIDGRVDGHLGLGFPTALAAVDVSAVDQARLDQLVVRADQAPPLLPPEAAAYFRLDRFELAGQVTVDAGFSVVLVVAGQVEARCADGSTGLAEGTTAVVPWSAGDLTLVAATGTVLVAQPPRPLR